MAKNLNASLPYYAYKITLYHSHFYTWSTEAKHKLIVQRANYSWPRTESQPKPPCTRWCFYSFALGPIPCKRREDICQN